VLLLHGVRPWWVRFGRVFGPLYNGHAGVPARREKGPR
jgi:hypothetical protein